MVFQCESEGTCTLTNTLRSENGEVAEVDCADFSVTLVNQGGANAPTITGSVADGTLTLSALDGAPLVYTRQ